jgi:hypothetical protein
MINISTTTMLPAMVAHKKKSKPAFALFTSTGEDPPIFISINDQAAPM